MAVHGAKSIPDMIEDAELLISHISKWGYPGAPIAALIHHAQRTNDRAPYDPTPVSISEVKGAYRSTFPYSVEWSDTEATLKLLDQLGLEVVWKAALPPETVVDNSEETR